MNGRRYKRLSLSVLVFIYPPLMHSFGVESLFVSLPSDGSFADDHWSKNNWRDAREFSCTPRYERIGRYIFDEWVWTRDMYSLWIAGTTELITQVSGLSASTGSSTRRATVEVDSSCRSFISMMSDNNPSNHSCTVTMHIERVHSDEEERRERQTGILCWRRSLIKSPRITASIVN